MKVLLMLAVFLIIGYAGFVVFKGFLPQFEKTSSGIETEPFSPSDSVPAQ